MKAKNDKSANGKSTATPVTRIEAISIPGPKRLNYHYGQLLSSDSFREEQMYFLHKLCQQNRAHFSTGVIKGLTLACSERLVTVSPGFAMDSLGQLIELSVPHSFELSGEAGTWDIIIELVDEKCNSSRSPDDFALSGDQQFDSIRETIKIWACGISNDEARVTPDTSVFLGRIKVNKGSFEVEVE